VSYQPVIWKAPFTNPPLVLQTPDGNGGNAYGASPDGTTIFGICNPIGGASSSNPQLACKWDTTTLAVTVLSNVDTTPYPNSWAIGCSVDKQIIIGGGFENGQTVSPVASWTGGGTAGSLLPFRTGATYTVLAWSHQTMPYRRWSDDGSVIIVNDNAPPLGGANATNAFKYVNRVPIVLPPTTAPPLSGASAQVFCMSADGNTVCGQDASGGSTPIAYACYWVGTTITRLPIPSGGTLAAVQYCSSDASVMWGQVAASSVPSGCFIWTGGSSVVGLPQLSNTQTGSNSFIYWAADDASAQTAVGVSPIGASTSHAVKWVGSTVTDLGALGGAGVYSQAACCSHNGTVVCGNSLDASSNQWPVWWSADNVIHALPLLNYETAFNYGDTLGVSRDGSVIFGYVDVPDVEPLPPPTVTLAMDDVSLVTIPTPGCQVFIDWSDDRGHVYGSPVGQQMGNRGEYIASLQWQRLGFARDRVFRIFWSCPAKTVLMGCWLEADTSAKT